MSLIEQDRTTGSLSGATGSPVTSNRSRRGLLGIGFAMVGAGVLAACGAESAPAAAPTAAKPASAPTTAPAPTAAAAAAAEEAEEEKGRGLEEQDAPLEEKAAV